MWNFLPCNNQNSGRSEQRGRHEMIAERSNESVLELSNQYAFQEADEYKD